MNRLRPNIYRMKHICNFNISAKYCKKILMGAPWGAPQSIKIVTFKFIYVFCNLNRTWRIPTMRIGRTKFDAFWNGHKKRPTFSPSMGEVIICRICGNQLGSIGAKTANRMLCNFYNLFSLLRD